MENTLAIPVFLKESIEDALMEEVFTTPKPGLVDCHDRGAHNDMDVNTFIASAHAITPYLFKMICEGYSWNSDIRELFPTIRRTGIQAEKAMFRATEGVNTHKGILFTMGILCAATGVCYRNKSSFDVSEILDLVERMMKHPMEAEFRNMKNRKPVTHGEWLYNRYGERGIRGEAQSGFPIIRKVAYPVMKNLRKINSNTTLTNINVLLSVMSTLNDTNILSRSNYQELNWVKETSIAILRLGGAFTREGYDAIIEMNRRCIEKNISPGGAADILAATLFLYKLDHKMGCYTE